MQSAPKFSIIFPTHNRCNYILHALNSFLRLKGLDKVSFELIIVANACVDDTVIKVRSKLKETSWDWKVVEESIAGLSQARNSGINSSSGEIIVFLDDDIEFDSNWLIGLSRSFLQGNFDIVGGKISLWWNGCEEPDWFTDYERRLLGYNDHGEGLIKAKSNMIFGGNFAFKRSLLDVVSGFNSTFGRVGKSKGAGEEADFINRAVNSGFLLGYSSLFEVKHLVTFDRLSLKALINFSRGAGKAKSKMVNYSRFQKSKKLLKYIYQFVKEGIKNPRHAFILINARLSELEIL